MQNNNPFLRNNNENTNPFSPINFSPPTDTLFGKDSNRNNNIYPVLDYKNNTFSFLPKYNSDNLFNNNDNSNNIFNNINNPNSIFQNNNIENKNYSLNPFLNSNNRNNTFQNLNLQNEQNNSIFPINNILDRKKDNIFLNHNNNTSSQFLNGANLSNQENGLFSNKNNLEISLSSKNNFDISPLYKNNLIYIKEYSNNDQNKIKIYKFESNSSNISDNLEKAIISHLENNFGKKEEKIFQNGDNLEIICQIIEPVKVCFTVDIGKKEGIFVLKKKICEKLRNANFAYSSLEKNSFCLMKNYCFIGECNNECGKIFCDCDNVYIILKETIKKVLNID